MLLLIEFVRDLDSAALAILDSALHHADHGSVKRIRGSRKHDTLEGGMPERPEKPKGRKASTTEEEGFFFVLFGLGYRR